ncbi:MAG: thioredoxin-disulfide reductase [Holosporales bacterium]|nr:thioredoxin-disulfide reductase [Holosporales bacterium]
MKHVRVLIIGSGPAGYTAAVYAARAGLAPVLFSGAHIGGQLVQSAEIENFPGFAKISGVDLMEKMMHQAEALGTNVIMESILRIEGSAPPFVCCGEKTQMTADSVIIATGAVAKWLNVKGEAEFKGRGVSACATCDGFFFRGQNVAVIGGGNTAVADALFLTNHAKSVTLIHRKSYLRAEQIMQDRLFSHPKVNIVWDSTVEELCGENKKLTHMRLRNVKDNAISQVDVDGVFVAIGHEPQSKIFQEKIKINEAGYIETFEGTTRTSMPGIFAAGDVMDPRYRQAVVAASRGCMAAIDAQEFLQ